MHLRLLLLSALVPGLLVVPVLTPPASAARPVAPVVTEIALDPPPAPRLTLRAAGPRTLLETTPRTVAPFAVAGVTWDPGSTAGLEIALRTRSGGTWSDWQDAEPLDDGESGPHVRPGTEPLWVGQADGVQARVRLLSGTAPTGIRLALVDPGASPADGAPAPRALSTAHADGPDVQSRAAWGADESIRRGSPSYSSTLKAVTLHHTASSNDYARADVPRLLRGFYAYHVKSNGWSDLGYNFLVDRFGTVWEGRYGGTSRLVMGAHAGGFNTSTVGISMIGTYGAQAPSRDLREGVARIAAWKMHRARVDPLAKVTLQSAGSTRWPAGRSVSLPTLFGHRDVSTTSCPGNLGYDALPGIRSRVAALIAGAAPLAPQPEEPVAEPLSVKAPAQVALGQDVPVTVHGTPGRPVQLWFVRTDGASGGTLRREDVFGADGTFTTQYVADAGYELFATSDGVAGPRTEVLAVGTPTSASPSPLTVRGPLTVEPWQPALVTVAGPAGTAFSLWFRADEEAAFVRRRQGVLGPDGTWTTTYSADSAHTYFAMSATVTSADATTASGPVAHGLQVSTPASAEPNAALPLVVQGRPGAAVELWFSREGAAFTRRREGVLGADGTFRTTWFATGSHALFATSLGRTSERSATQVGSSVASSPTSAPASGAGPTVTAAPGVDAGRSNELVVHGTPGRDVQVWFRPRPDAVFTQRRAGTFDADGTYRTSYVATDDQQFFATSSGTASVDAVTDVRPVLAAAAAARLGTVLAVRGRARPGQPVVVEQQRRAGGQPLRLTGTANTAGTFEVRATLTDESDFRPRDGERTGSSSSTTRVSPTVSGPPRAGRGSVVRLSGTARPGAAVEVLFRRQGGTEFTVGRRLTADAAGRWSTTFGLSAPHRYYARADGLSSTSAVTAFR